MGLVLCRKAALKHPSPRENKSWSGLCLPWEHGHRSVTNATTQNISETFPVRLKPRHSPAKVMAVMNRAVKSTASITWHATRASGFISMLWPAEEQTFSASVRAPRAATRYRSCQDDERLVSSKAGGLGVILGEKYQKFFSMWNKIIYFFIYGNSLGNRFLPSSRCKLL